MNSQSSLFWHKESLAEDLTLNDSGAISTKRNSKRPPKNRNGHKSWVQMASRCDFLPVLPFPPSVGHVESSTKCIRVIVRSHSFDLD